MWRHQNRKMKKRSAKNPLRKKVFNIFLGFFIACGLIAYIFQVNGLSTKGYTLKELERKISAAKETERELEGKTLELQSMSTLSHKVKNLNMIKIQDAIYLHPDERTVLK